ncbi:MAG: radical SAM protein [Desulfuromonadales bacterium]
MKVTLVQPYYFNIWEAIGLGYIAAYCKKNFTGNLELDFFQSNFDKDEDVVRCAADSDIVAFSCTSPTFRHGLCLAEKIKQKKPGVKIVFGGNHVSALKEFIQYPVIDQIVTGEGEHAFLEILEGNNNRIVAGKPRDFGQFPWPDRDLIRNDRTIDLCNQMTGKRIASFQANRVCPFCCSYCSEKAVTGIYNSKTNPIRSRDVNDLLDEIEFVAARYKLDAFKFVDATFDTSAEYVISFCREKIRRNNLLDWECMIHATLADREIFPWLKKAGCIQINVGCESGSQRILNAMKKGVTLEKIRSVFEWARDYGIMRRAFFIIGMPDETEEDLIMTENFAALLAPDVFGATILCPYPGSDLYDHETMSHIEWDMTDEYSNDFWSTKHMSNCQLKAWQKRLSDKFKNNLAWHQQAVIDRHTDS